MIENSNPRNPAANLDYRQDALPRSMAHEDGGVTERNLIYALARSWWES